MAPNGSPLGNVWKYEYPKRSESLPPHHWIVGMTIPNIWENKKSSKPPTSFYFKPSPGLVDSTFNTLDKRTKRLRTGAAKWAAASAVGIIDSSLTEPFPRPLTASLCAIPEPPPTPSHKFPLPSNLKAKAAPPNGGYKRGPGCPLTCLTN